MENIAWPVKITYQQILRNTSSYIMGIFLLSLVFGVSVSAANLPIGAECEGNGDCKSGDCEESQNNGKSYCDCSSDDTCTEEYSSQDRETWDCVDGAHATYDLDYCVSNLRGVKYPITPREASLSDQLLDPAINAEELLNITGKPVTKITIPGVSFSDIQSVKEDDKTFLLIPFIGEYIAAVYKYAIVVVSIIAVIVIILAGFMWTVSGGDPNTISQAKKMIGHMSVGLIIALGSYTILYTINPALVQFKNLKVEYIDKVTIYELEYVSNSGYESLTGKFILPKEEILKITKQVTASVGLDDECYLITIIGKESGGNPAAIGHDENYPRPTCVGSRRSFLLSGKKFGGEVFTPPVSDAKDFSCEKHNGTKDAGGKLIVNNDRFDPSSPPDYGLDWRFSHGFGLGQVTLKGDSAYFCNNQRGINAYGKCFNIPDLLTVEAAAFFSGKLFQSNLTCAQNKGYSGDQKIQAAFWAYAAGCGKVEPSRGQDISGKPGVPRAWAHYQSCKANANKFGAPEPNGTASVE